MQIAVRGRLCAVGADNLMRPVFKANILINRYDPHNRMQRSAYCFYVLDAGERLH